MLEFITERFPVKRVRPIAICMAALILMATPGPSFGVTLEQLATGVQTGLGVALDDLNSQLYYVEYITGTLKRIDLPPTCDVPSTPACSSTIVTVADGFSDPMDVALDLDNRLAYVTTSVNPGSGGLWRVAIPPD
ncbi:MAG: hypothetical protein GY869_16910, partial [Planctomycetes bacterium]|nr:hypothetical protein [Planctomycetota bacterium]